MKSKSLFLSFLMLLAVATSYAQTSASASGIAIQGIARDINNTAKTNATIVLKFTIYYGAGIEIYNVSKTLVTDSFGVFSTVIEPGVPNNSKIANNQAFLKIEEGSTIISDEQLRHVPYAISANNGVPPGSIMPYIGATAPAGWLLCDGLTNVPNPSALYDLIGAKTPNLQGMFLRGTGTSPVNSQDGPLLKETQQDEIESHSSTGATTTTGNHDHTETRLRQRLIDEEDSEYNANVLTGADTEITVPTGGTGSHSHNVSVSYSGASETRPVNYGVNYIIKL